MSKWLVLGALVLTALALSAAHHVPGHVHAHPHPAVHSVVHPDTPVKTDTMMVTPEAEIVIEDKVDVPEKISEPMEIVSEKIEEIKPIDKEPSMLVKDVLAEMPMEILEMLVKPIDTSNMVSEMFVKPMETPDMAVEIPAKPIEMPAMAVEIPAKPIEMPDMAVEIPAKLVETPDMASDMPLKPMDTPEMAAEIIVKPIDTPDMVAEMPFKPMEMPSKPMETSEMVEETPAKPMEMPMMVEEMPSKPMETSEMVEETPAKPMEMPMIVEEMPSKPMETPTMVEEMPAKPIQTPEMVAEVPAKLEDTPMMEETPSKPMEMAAEMLVTPEETSMPAEMAAKPMEEMPMPAKVAANPMEEMPMPAEMAAKPMEEMPMPAEVAAKPMEEMPMPAEMAAKPMEEMPMPAEMAAKPMEEMPMPAVMATKPMETPEVPEEDAKRHEEPESREMYSGAQLLRVLATTDEQKDLLLRLEESRMVDTWLRPAKGKGLVDIMVPEPMLPTVKQRLADIGATYTVVIQDVKTAIEAENPTMSEDESNELVGRNGHRMTWNSYHRLADIHGYLDYLAQTFPDLCSVSTIGTSVEGKPLRLLRISSRKGRQASASRPAFWIDGGIHAREWISPASVAYVIQQLVENHDSNTDITEGVDFYVLPVVNPDGYEYTHTRERLWRKNRKDPQSGRCAGTDLNRNWGYKWGGAGSSKDKCKEIYAGPAPFSEPETQAIRNFVTSQASSIKAYVTFHSYGQYILYPWGYDRKVPPDYMDLDRVGKQAASAMRAAGGASYQVGNSASLLYPASGGADDWAKGGPRIKYTYTIELRDKGQYGFLLPAQFIAPTAKEAFAAVRTIAKAILSA